MRKKRTREVEAEVRRECEYLGGRQTIWTDARWYEVLTRERVQEIVSEYGYGPLRDSRTNALAGAADV